MIELMGYQGWKIIIPLLVGLIAILIVKILVRITNARKVEK